MQANTPIIRNSNGSITLSLLLIPEYTMIAVLSTIEPLRIANRFAGKDIFHWQLITEDGNPVRACNNLMLEPTLAISDNFKPDNVFVCSSYNPERYITPKTINWLKRLRRQGSILGAMDTGCYFLQAAKLLNRSLITLHWEAVPAFQEDHPQIRISSELFEIDQNLITCAGGTASTDLMLHIIQAECGRDLAVAVCEQLIKTGMRSKSEQQRFAIAPRYNIYHPRLLRVLEAMEENLATPLQPKVLADYACLSLRQLERLFRTHLEKSPSSFYMKLRLDRAQQLLKESHLSILEVGVACGFISAAHFSRAYRKQFQISPSDDR